jgi:hypothetical protein
VPLQRANVLDRVGREALNILGRLDSTTFPRRGICGKRLGEGFFPLRDADKCVSRPDPGVVSRSPRSYTSGHETAVFFNPPDAVVRSGELAFFLEINCGENNRGDRQKS